MIHTFVGNLGHYSVIVAFVAALVSAFSYGYAAKLKDKALIKSWQTYARSAFFIHGFAVISIIASLFYIIYNHYYEYHYAWSHSSNNLPTHFMISCFWEGQEGSFLLWIFWHVLLGFFLIRTGKKWEMDVMSVFAFVQAFLVSMILGLVVFNIKIGSSPFALLRDVMDAPIFASDPNFVPKDGTGLNPLLQNYWMVIHPPTLFLGFALTLVPFAFCIAGLRQGLYKEWVKPALPWAQVGAVILGVGIMMGAYWAYETLNFGGYWNWDPVENAVYIPWLILVASIHVMITFRRKDTALKASMILVITSFILVLYATFLTRSGVLGDASVHSFTDLGLSGQLLIYLLAFTAVSVFYLIKAWRDLPSTEEEITAYSREFWIFMGATVLCLAAFQVLVPTSIPVYNSLIEAFGGSSNMAPPADQVIFYTKFQLWFGVAIALLSGTGQFFWWQKIDKERLISIITMPIIITLILTSLAILFLNVTDLIYITLLTVAVYSVVSNSFVLFRLAKQKVKLTGGSVTHIGIALMLIGILFSSGYSKVISLNTTGLLYNREFPEEMNKENLLLFRNQPQRMLDYSSINSANDVNDPNAKYGYTLVYKGPRMESDDFPGYIDQEILLATNDPFRVVLKKDLVYKGETFHKKGDTIQIYNENTYYEIEYTRPNGSKFSLYPRIQNNPQMGFVPSPDIRSFAKSDLYTHVTNIPDPESEIEWSDPEQFVLSIGDTFIVNDYIAVLDNVVRTEDILQVELNEGDVAVRAEIRVLGNGRNFDVRPVYLIKDRQIGMLPDVLPDLGLRVQFEKIDPESGQFTFMAQTTQKDWVILKAIEKPFINILWIGTLIMSLGFCIAIYRRFTDLNKEDEKVKTASKKGKQQKAHKLA